VAVPWLVRLSFEVPAEILPTLPPEEKDWIMEAREWYEQSLKQAEDRGTMRKTARLYGLRLGRPLTDAERDTLAERLTRLGEDRVDQVMLTFSPDDLAAWLTDPNAQ
jgi:hypothetical protein